MNYNHLQYFGMFVVVPIRLTFCKKKTFYSSFIYFKTFSVGTFVIEVYIFKPQIVYVSKMFIMANCSNVVYISFSVLIIARL